MASATKAKTKDSASASEASSVPGLILAAVLRHNKDDALNYRSEDEWHEGDILDRESEGLAKE